MRKMNVVHDSGWSQKAKKLVKDRSIDIGLFSAKSDSELVGYAAANEFGAEIKIKAGSGGGAAYGFRTKKDATANKIRFLKKGKGFFEAGRTGGVKSDNTIIIPERSFLRGTLLNQHTVIKNFIIQQTVMLLTRKITEKIFYRSIGLFVKNMVVDRINKSKNWAVPNSPTTVKLKGSDQPLVDSGRMKQSVTWRIGGKLI